MIAHRLGRALLAVLEGPLRKDVVRATRADVLVVLGAACRHGRPGRFAAERARVAAGLFARGVAPLIHLTGGKPERGVSEAEALARYLEDLGVPRERMSLEEASRSTWENAVNSAPLLGGHARVLLV